MIRKDCTPRDQRLKKECIPTSTPQSISPNQEFKKDCKSCKPDDINPSERFIRRDCRSCIPEPPPPYRLLTPLILQCFQRTLDKRPYKNLTIIRKFFEKRLKRPYDCLDLNTTLKFLEKYGIQTFELSFIKIPTENRKILEKFAYILNNMIEVKLINVNLPEDFILYLTKINGLIRLSKIELLDISNNILNRNQIHLLRCFIMYSDHLKILNIGYCGLNEITLPIIADGIIKSKTLKAIDLSRLELTSSVGCYDDTKIPFIYSILLSRNKLIEIHLRSCCLDSFGIIPIAEYIQCKQTTLKYLDIGSNIIGPNGIKAILKAICISKKLIGLDISGNKLGSLGGEIIGHLLPYTRIQYLNIQNNRIGHNAMNLIFSTIKKSCEIKYLFVWYNGFDPQSGHILQRQLEAEVIFFDSIDFDITFDMDAEKFRVIPQVKLPNSCGNMDSKIKII